MTTELEDNLLPIYMSAGELVISWALLESGLEKLANYMFTEGGKPFADRQRLPYEFKRKAAFIGRCLREVTPFQPFADEGAGLLDRARVIANTRRTIIHGALSGFDANSGKLTFVRLEADGDIHRVRVEPITLLELHAVSADCHSLANDLFKFTMRVIR